MADETTNTRIVLSRHTLALYEAGAGDVLVAPEMVRDEVAVLRAIVAEYPEKAASVGELVQRWEALAGRLG